MIDTFLSGGVLMWPLLLIGIGILALAGRTAYLLAGRPEVAPGELDAKLQALLFWGAVSVALGFLGTTVGVVITARAISLAGTVDPPLVWSGIAVTLVTLIFGLLIFLVSALLWFALRWWKERGEDPRRRWEPAGGPGDPTTV